MKKILLMIPLFCSSCFRDSADSFSLAPANPYSSWTPMKGNTLISAKLCETLLPPTFGKDALSLAELIDIGLLNNPATKQTWAMAREAAAQYGSSLSSFYPTITNIWQYSRTRGTFSSSSAGGQTLGGLSTPPTTSAFYTTTAGPDFELVYNLFDFGARSAAALAAREALYYADWTHNQQIQTSVQTIMKDYYNYLYQLKLLSSNEADLDSACASLDAANERFSLGLAALGDVAQARTQYLQAKITVTTQKQNTETAFAQLAFDLGLPANIEFKVQPMPDEIQAEPMLASVDELVQIAQTQRQDLLAAQANVRAKEASILNAKRSGLPVLATSLDIGKYWFQTTQEDYHWIAELTLNIPIFQGYYFKNQLKNAIANKEQASAQLLQTELSIVQAVTTSHMNVITSAQNVKDTKEYLKAAELDFDIALASYKAGTKTILDVLSAQSSLADARTKIAGSQRDWFISLAALSYATGCLCLPAIEGNCNL